MKYCWYYAFPQVNLGFMEENGAITDIFFGSDPMGALTPSVETPAIKLAAGQMAEYLGGARKAFDFPMAPKGTAFQKSVWGAASAIPYGETRSYKEIAIRVGNPNASRAVGMANNRNPIAIAIPCHRVVGSDGSLVGYGGGLEVKRFLLGLESGNIRA